MEGHRRVRKSFAPSCQNTFIYGLCAVFRRFFGRWLPPFINLISSANAELGQTLMLLQKQSGLQDDPANAMISNETTDGVDLDTLTYQENVLDTPSLITRSALYIYLNAMVGFDICLDRQLALKDLSSLDDRYVMILLYIHLLVRDTM